MACLPRLVVIVFLREDRKADLDRAVEQIRLGEAERQNALAIADVGLHRQGLAQAEEVVGAVAEPDEGTRQSAHAAGQADAVLALLLHLESQVDGAVFFVQVALGDVGIVGLQLLEVPQLIKPQQAEFPKALVVNLAFLERDFAADHFVAGGGVAVEFDSPHVELLALVHVNVEQHQFLVLVEGGVGNRGEVDVTQFAVGVAQVVQALGDFCRGEKMSPSLMGKSERRALALVTALLFLNVISPSRYWSPSSIGNGDVDRLARLPSCSRGMWNPGCPVS